MGATIRQQLLKELDKASPEFLWQLFQFVQFLKQAELKANTTAHPMQRFIGCMKGAEGDAFAASLEKEFNQIEGEW
jgi:hypothetical protein